MGGLYLRGVSALILSDISKSFGTTTVLRGVSLDVAEGDFYFLLGASGCGKSTLLRIIAGLEEADSGTVTLNGEDLGPIAPHKRGIGMVFQQYALWPHMTVAQNISFGLEVQRIERAEREKMVAEALKLVRMEGLGARYPHQISGGQQQRVALARALAVRPKLLLLDEPLSNLDARLRDEIREELLHLHSTLKITMIYVTHDQEDALTLATKIALLRGGMVEQIGAPSELYETPRTRYAAEFLGRANIISGRYEGSSPDGGALVSIAASPSSLVETRSQTAHKGDSALLCVRPEAVTVTPVGAGTQPVRMSGRVRQVLYKGAYLEIECEIGSGERVLSRTVSTEVSRTLTQGMEVEIGWGARSAVVVAE